MKHVLFVDDEPNVLAGLQRMLRGLRQEWTMEFVGSGESALAYLDEHAVDVIVSDMRMPGMDGAQLLREVVIRHPSVVRIALSGQSDHETLLKVAGLAHQFLSKPCDTETVKTTVRRALALRDHFADETLKRLVSRMSSIPSLPTNYQEILQELKSSEPSLHAVGEIIAKDVAMTAKVLQLVNSAFFGIPRRVTDPMQAVTLLGLQTVNGLVLSAGVFSQFEHTELTVFVVDDLINHSLHVASRAKSIAASQGHDDALCNDAFVAGVLHDIGKLVLATNFPKQYGQAISAAKDWGHSLNTVERETFGADHADVGAYILSLWGLPTALIEAVAFHHDPKKSLATGFTPLTAVHVANALCQSGNPGGAAGVDLEYLEGIGASRRLAQWQALVGARELAGAI